MMRAAYTALGILAMPLVRLWLKRRTARGKEDAARLQERFGVASLTRPAGRLIWLHAASVGEVQSVLTLSQRLLAGDAALHLLITSGTVTSAALLAQSATPRLLHQYVPVDLYGPVRRFLNHWQPDLALWVESEFWPQLIWQAQTRRIPMLLMNARMSARSQRGWQRWPRSIAALLNGFDRIYAGTPEDAARLRALGATQVEEAGNLKDDAAPLPVDPAALAQLQQVCAGRALWLAASTHANEETMVAQAHRMVMAQHPHALCIIVPRHAVRGDTIAAELREAGFTVTQRSKQQLPDATTSIYLADTMGELGLFYRLCDLAFIGGSLVAHGGHNPLEPARLGCALLSGPHMHNFASIAERFTQAGALTVTPTAGALGEAIAAAMDAPAQIREMAANAQQCVTAQPSPTDAILTRIGQLLA